MIIKKDFPWVRYSVENAQFDDDKVGKWMSHFSNDFDAVDYIAEACKEAIERGIVKSCKHSNVDGIIGPPTGVACFYIHGDDEEAHRRVIAYFLEKNLIRKTKAGRLYNISFKYDKQTLAGEYGKDFESEIKLEQFVNLNTGEWLKK